MSHTNHRRKGKALVMQPVFRRRVERQRKRYHRPTAKRQTEE